MKKLGICLLAIILVGCQGKITSKENSHIEGHYKKEDIELVLTLEDDFKEGFHYEIRYHDDEMSDYATFDDENKKNAVSAVTEDGYTLRFTLEKDKVIIKEDGQSYLEIALSGEYHKD